MESKYAYASKDGMTVGDLREFLKQCEKAGVPDTALLSEVRTKGFSGKLSRLAVVVKPPARGPFG